MGCPRAESASLSMQLQLQKLRGAAGEISTAARSQSDDGRRITGRLLKHSQSSDQQLTDARDKLTSLRQAAEIADNRLKSVL